MYLYIYIYIYIYTHTHIYNKKYKDILVIYYCTIYTIYIFCKKGKTLNLITVQYYKWLKFSWIFVLSNHSFACISRTEIWTPDKARFKVHFVDVRSWRVLQKGFYWNEWQWKIKCTLMIIIITLLYFVHAHKQQKTTCICMCVYIYIYSGLFCITGFLKCCVLLYNEICTEWNVI